MSETALVTCQDCPRRFPQEEFPAFTVKGRTYYQPRCRECHRRYARKYYHDNKQRILQVREARRDGDEIIAASLLKRNQRARERESLGEFKKCSRCERLGRDSVHPKSRFSKSSYAVDGLQPWCNQCVSEDQAEKRKRTTVLRTLYLVSRYGQPASEAPVSGAFKAKYPAAAGGELVGWFVRLPKATDLRSFLDRYGPAQVGPAAGNPEVKEIKLNG